MHQKHDTKDGIALLTASGEMVETAMAKSYGQ